MTRKVQQTHATVIGGTLTARALDDVTLVPDLSIDGQPPVIRGSDEKMLLGRIRCEGCNVVALVHGFRTAAGGPPLLVARSRIVTDWDARPVAAVMIQSRVTVTTFVEADCPAHGQVLVPGHVVTDLAVRGMHARSNQDQPPVLFVRPAGGRREIRSGQSMTPDEASRWLGWDTPAQ